MKLKCKMLGILFQIECDAMPQIGHKRLTVSITQKGKKRKKKILAYLFLELTCAKSKCPPLFSCLTMFNA